MRNCLFLVPSNFSFSHNVFHSYISLARQNAALCGNGLKPRARLFGSPALSKNVHFNLSSCHPSCVFEQEISLSQVLQSPTQCRLGYRTLLLGNCKSNDNCLYLTIEFISRQNLRVSRLSHGC